MVRFSDFAAFWRLDMAGTSLARRSAQANRTDGSEIVVIVKVGILFQFLVVVFEEIVVVLELIGVTTLLFVIGEGVGLVLVLVFFGVEDWGGGG